MYSFLFFRTKPFRLTAVAAFASLLSAGVARAESPVDRTPKLIETVKSVKAPPEGGKLIDSTIQPGNEPSAAAGTAPAAEAGGSAKRPQVVIEREWYSGQMAAIYIPAALLIGVGAASNSPRVVSTGWIGVFVAPPILHVANGNGIPALASFGLRILFIGTAIAFAEDCVQIPLFGGDATTSSSRKCDVLGVSIIAEMIALPVVDFSLASKSVERQAPRIGLALVPRPDSRSLSLALAGSF
jgi:hypothetical protein